MHSTPTAPSPTTVDPHQHGRHGPAAERLGAFSPQGLVRLVQQPRSAVRLLARPGDGARGAVPVTVAADGCTELGVLPGVYPEWLGDRGFLQAHGVRYPYVCGEMANGISTVDLVAAVAAGGVLGFFGAAGLAPRRVEEAVLALGRRCGDASWGVNLIHSPAEPRAEEETVELLLRHRVPCVSASAFMELTAPVVRCAVAGLRTDRAGAVVRARRVFAKVSRPETARMFMSPAPRELLDELVRSGRISVHEARLAESVPVAEDVTVEADSGGHTDNRSLTTLLLRILRLRDAVERAHGHRVRVGAAGGLGTPDAVAAAFAMGAAYAVTGSVNQTAVEAGMSPQARQLLAAADVDEVTMAPSADMFELGARVQVLSKGTMFAVRAQRLYELYRRHSGLDELPGQDLAWLEREVLRAPVAEVWRETERYWRGRDPGQCARAATDDKHRMALLFRWYLGQSTRWAIEGCADRRADYQLWAGPALGAFNAWVADSFLAAPGERTVVQIARNLLEGAAVVTRAQQLRTCGLPVPDTAFRFVPRPLA
ncbi:PfaD family polyunsaturated fatty acid/polyketide biosynthesis protein [Streptomyces sp. NPDC048171]|uniref:PfaD family polyunsaturated fatty acid/polyketide biosynthesis protein n=1 Tax=Streptomyces sp. NPDC048171 TaxID=3365504 RepID=UPI0037106E91